MSHSLAQPSKGAFRLLIALLVVLGMVAVPAGKIDALEPTVEQILVELSFGGISFIGFDGEFVVEVTDPENVVLFRQDVSIGGDRFEIQPEELGFALLPDMVISVGDKEFVIPDELTIDTFDTDNDNLAGTAPAESLLDIVIGGDQCSAGADVIDGRWSFDVESKCGFGLDFDTWAEVRLLDNDGDYVVVWWEHPRFGVNFEGPNGGASIEGRGWPYGTQLEITVDDGDGTRIETVFETVDGLAGFGPDQGPNPTAGYTGMSSFLFSEFGEGFQFQPGWTVTIGPADSSSPYPTKDHVITQVLPTGVDFEADTVYGTAAPGTELVVYGCPVDWETFDWETYAGLPWGGSWSRLVEVAQDGTWSADFSKPGFAQFGLDDFQYVTETCELSGYEFGMSQFDDDFDATDRQYIIPNINASLNQGEWITIGRVNGGPKLIEILSESGGEVLWSDVLTPDRGEDRAPFEIGYDTHGIDLQPGMVVRLPGGELILAELTMEFDIDDDVIFGTAHGAETVWISAGSEFGQCQGNIPVENGAWSASEADLYGEGEWGEGEEPPPCEGFDLTKQSSATVIVEDPTDLDHGYEGDTTRLEWEQPTQWANEEIAGFIEFLISEADGKDAKSLEKALDRIWHSLDPEYWVDYRTLDPDDGYKVFVRQAEAATALMKIETLSIEETDDDGSVEVFEFSGTDVAGWLVGAVDRPLVDLAIQRAEAADGDPKLLAKAYKSMDRADEAMEQGDPSGAIENLGVAWKHAQRALR